MNTQTYKSLITGPVRKSLMTAICTSSLVTLSLDASAEETSASDSRFSTGISIGATGIGVTSSAITDFHLTENDQIQWRLSGSGISADVDSDDEFDVAGIDYNDGVVSAFAIQGGLDWYPVSSGWADEIFVSGGLMWSSFNIDVDANTSKDLRVGGSSVNAGDLTSLTTKIENNQLMPYLGIGWGNKITGERGFDFQVELGIAAQTRDADVSVAAVDPTSVLSAADLEAEKREVEDEMDGILAFGSVSLLYHF